MRGPAIASANMHLVTHAGWSEPHETFGMNSYLFRETERRLFQQGRKPLSAITHMIGSQATKGMHVLAKFAPVVESCGVWTDRKSLYAIETYPAVCRDARKVIDLLGLLGRRLSPPYADIDDALACALVAYLFATDREALEQPAVNVPPCEGWIWAPRRPDAPMIGGKNR